MLLPSAVIPEDIDLDVKHITLGVEESWLGPWKCLLLSEPLDSSCLDSVIRKMSFALKCKFDFYANESLLRVVLGGSRSVSEMEERNTHLLLRNGCLTKWGSCPGKKYDLSSTAYDHAETHSGKLLHQLILEAIDDIEAECTSREPIILDLDSDVQKEKKKKWDEKNQEAIAEAVKNLDQFDQVISINLF
ncbi:hypothetical protein IFM89_012947 [Coptis chinensis]|uniref:Uncharacterized protein n=1 Tax=Coptis chinensis TaxID=261450 RepID=A0A835IV48_9MAGN|nr:hypothetical protein IFM89_012947 [Coptis chinensis]